MKSLSMYGVAMAAALVMLCSSFTSDKGVATAAGPSIAAAQNTYYYWYLTDGTYEGYYTVGEEEENLEAMYDVEVGTDSLGGTLLADGFPYYGLPHLVWPTSSLYGYY